MADLPARREAESNSLSPEERYMRDPAFHLLVDTLVREIVRANYTPTEIREAAMLACIRVESFRIRQSPFGRTP